jgi:hypothetical protein
MMNARGNIVVKYPNKQLVYLYTAKDGGRLPKILKNSLIRARERWGDTQTLARIIFSELTQREPLGLNGYGISPTLMDNDNYILAVDDKTEMIGAFAETGQRRGLWTFGEFIDKSELSLEWNKLIPRARFDDEVMSAMPVNFDYPMRSDF